MVDVGQRAIIMKNTPVIKYLSVNTALFIYFFSSSLLLPPSLSLSLLYGHDLVQVCQVSLRLHPGPNPRVNRFV